MLMLFGLSLAFISYFLINHKVRYKKQRKRIGCVLVVAGASSTVLFDQVLHDFYVWAFVVAWIIGLELWFNCEKYGGNYP
jgi:hypothetical protein